VTHALTGRARFLGDDSGIMASRTTFDTRRRRVVHGKVGLYIPKDVLERKRKRFLRNGQVLHRAELMNNSAFDIICRYQWEYRGLVEDYAMAQNLASLTHLRWTMETSLLKTLAHKNRTSVRQTGRRLRGTAQTPYGPRRCLKITIPREGKKPLMAILGGLSLTRRLHTAIKDSGLLPYIPYRSEVLDKLLRSTCELCGVTGEVAMHHIRTLADLNQKGRREKPLWMRIMSARRRKTLAVCRPCHMDIQYNRPKSAEKGYRRAG
jgi:AI2M/AI1M-like, HNH endonuclease/Type II intron maturase